jgi:hypothetical protein
VNLTATAIVVVSCALKFHARDVSVVVAVAGFVPPAVAEGVAGHVCRYAYVAFTHAVAGGDAVDALAHVP